MDTPTLIQALVERYERCPRYSDRGRVSECQTDSTNSIPVFSDVLFEFQTIYDSRVSFQQIFFSSSEQESFSVSSSSGMFLVRDNVGRQLYDSLPEALGSLFGVSRTITGLIPGLLLGCSTQFGLLDPGDQLNSRLVENGVGESYLEVFFKRDRRRLTLVVEGDEPRIRSAYVEHDQQDGSILHTRINYFDIEIAPQCQNSSAYESNYSTEDKVIEACTLRPRRFEPSEDGSVIVIQENCELLRKGYCAVAAKHFARIIECTTSSELIEYLSVNCPKYVMFNTLTDSVELTDLLSQLRTVSPRSIVCAVGDSYTVSKNYLTLGRNGVLGICLASSGGRILDDCIATNLQGHRYVDPVVLGYAEQKSTIQDRYRLTVEEFELLLRLDFRDQELSKELAKPVVSIQKLIASLLRKLGAQSRTRASLICKENGLTPLPVLPIYDKQTGVNLEKEEAVRQALCSIASLEINKTELEDNLD